MAHLRRSLQFTMAQGLRMGRFAMMQWASLSTALWFHRWATTARRQVGHGATVLEAADDDAELQ